MKFKGRGPAFKHVRSLFPESNSHVNNSKQVKVCSRKSACDFFLNVHHDQDQAYLNQNLQNFTPS